MKTRAVIASNGYDLSEEAIITWERVSTTSLDRASERQICEEVLPELQGNIDKITTDFLFYAKDGDMEFEFYPVYALTIVYSANGVTISTSGINAEILKYCREKYNDGITFEIFNYYNNALEREQLQAKLNNSTISFTNATKVYVNAFGYVDGAADDWACVVKPTDIEDRTLPPAEGVMSEREKSILYIYIKE